MQVHLTDFSRIRGRWVQRSKGTAALLPKSQRTISSTIIWRRCDRDDLCFYNSKGFVRLAEGDRNGTGILLGLDTGNLSHGTRTGRPAQEAL